MSGVIRRAATRIREIVARQPVLILIAVGLLGAAGVSAGGYYAYRTYDYIQHDNDFCMSCHLMSEPYELFAQSAHRGLGCKACHQPTFAARSQMALTQIIENPDSIAVHAEVPNAACATCHIEGDPETWETIRNSAGHRVHLESDDPSLQGLMCVQCHSSSLHEFAATDQTCAQSGCHTDVEVRLGRMGDFTIHCAACHGFSRSIPTTAEVAQAREALAPTQNECLSCHVMRTLVEMPPDEPHDQVCATCHNPHDQTTPQQAVETCSSVGCHDAVQDLSSFHRGLDHAEVQNCTQCHTAHTWEADGEDCLSCHQDIFEDGGRSASRYLHAPVPVHRPTFGGPPPIRLIPAAAVAVQEPAARQRGTAEFRHSVHRNVDCTSCHSSAERHGALTVTDIADCRSCHHEGAPAADCASCHLRSTLAAAGSYDVPQRIAFSVFDAPVARDLPFGHGDHPEVSCSTCHQAGLTRPADGAACLTCHSDHHTVGATCISCHEAPAASAHTVQAHLGCTGAGCHENPPIERAPRDRQGCLVCHQDLVDHRPEGECAECHQLPGVGAP